MLRQSSGLCICSGGGKRDCRCWCRCCTVSVSLTIFDLWGNRAKHFPYKNNKRYEGEKRTLGEPFKCRHFGPLADSGSQVEFGYWEEPQRQVSRAMIHPNFIRYSCPKFTVLSKKEASLSSLERSRTVGLSNSFVLTAACQVFVHIFRLHDIPVSKIGCSAVLIDVHSIAR